MYNDKIYFNQIKCACVNVIFINILIYLLIPTSLYLRKTYFIDFSKLIKIS